MQAFFNDNFFVKNFKNKTLGIANKRFFLSKLTLKLICV